MKALTRRDRSILGLTGFVLAMAAPLACLDSDQATQLAASPQIEVSPGAGVHFAGSMLDATQPAATEEVVIFDRGRSPLRILALTVEEDDPVRELRLVFVAPGGDVGSPAQDGPSVEAPALPACPSPPFTLAPEASSADPGDPRPSACRVWLLHEPRDRTADRGRLKVRSNDPGLPLLELPLTTPDSQPQLVVDPPLLELGRVELGEEAAGVLRLRNGGLAPLRLERPELAADGEGQLSLDWLPGPDGTLPEFPLLLPPAGLAADPGAAAEVVLRLRVRPARSGAIQGRVRLTSDDPRARQLEVPVSAQVGRRCLAVVPGALDFGDVALGQVSDRSVTITNCGDAPVRLETVRFDEAGTAPAFALIEVPAELSCVAGGGSGDRSCTGDVELPAGAALAVSVRFVPQGEGPAGGLLLLGVADSAGGEVASVRLHARGTTNSCPIAVATARVVGAGQWEEAAADGRVRLEVPPLASVEMTGAASHDPDGQALAGYRWQVLERPADSTAQVFPHEGASTVTFFVDVIGRYLFSLDVVDAQGLPSCTPALVEVEVVVGSALHVQLTWDTPGDPDQTDEGFAAGTDLDLHLLHPLGDWFELPWDCYYGDPLPDWANSGQLGDDPSLDRDDTDGAGPENIHLDEPEQRRAYRIGVHAFNDHGYGPSLATVRIYVDGLLVAEFAGRRLPGTDSFWDVATVSWPGGRIEAIDQLTQIQPGGGGGR